MKRTPSDVFATVAMLIAMVAPPTTWAAGNVTAAVTDGDLVIRGDAADNAFAAQLGEAPIPSRSPASTGRRR